MIRRAVFVSALLAASPVLAQDSDGGSGMAAIKSLAGAKGVCAALTVDSATVPCGDAAINIVYRNGSASIMIKTGDANLVSFYGTPGHTGGGGTIISVEKVTMTHNGQTPAITSVLAVGRCTPGEIRAARVHVDCAADTTDGRHYAASFTAGDEAPMLREMQ